MQIRVGHVPQRIEDTELLEAVGEHDPFHAIESSASSTFGVVPERA